MSSVDVKFQPIILVIADNKRLECPCGALATFVNVTLDDNGNMDEVCVSCHDCYCENREVTE